MLALSALAMLGLACAKGPGEEKPKDVYDGDTDTPRHFVVLPVNLTVTPPEEFKPVLDDVFGAIAGYIRGRGDSLETFSRRDATARWAESILEVKKSEVLEDNFETAMSVFVSNLAKERSFDSVIAPTIVYRSTKTREKTVKWDGVFRKIDVINLSDEAKNKGLGRNISFEIVGVSLHVMVFEPDGEMVFERYGGLDLAHNVDMAGVEFTMAPGLAVKPDLLKDTEHLSEGFERAFGTYLPPR